jgi:hypothetical protein
VNDQLGNKAYRLDHSLQTHFSERERRQNNLRFVAMAGTASSNARSRWPPRGRALGLESAALRWPLGEWRQNGAVGTASARIWRGASHSRLANNRRAQARASLRGCAVAGF